MNLSKSKFVFDRVQELSRILLNPGNDNQTEAEEVHITFEECDKYMRMLRPAGQGSDHSNAARLRLRQKLLNHPSTGSEGPVLLSRFDGTCETLKKINSRLLGPFLSFLMPVSFVEPHSTAFQDAFQAERTIFNNAPQFDLNAKPKVLRPVVQEELAGSVFPSSTKDLFPPASQRADLLASSPLPCTVDFWVSAEVERKLLQDVLFVLQGVTGKHIKFDSRSDSYVVDPVLGVPAPARDLVLCICELGWLFNKVAAYLKTVFASATDSRGLTVQAFGFSLQEEMNEYYRLLAVIEQELNRAGGETPALADKIHRGDAFASKLVADPAPGEGNTGLTLLRLKAWMQEPTQRMLVLARLVDGAQGLTGGALISRLHAHCRHGDLQTCEAVQRIMGSVCAPLHTFVTRWVLDGDLTDGHSEFFIAVNPSPAIANIWKDTYLLRDANVPIFLPHVLAQKMVNIGKSINFMKLCVSRLALTKSSAPSKKSRTHTAQGGRKSYRMINKARRLGMYGQVLEDEQGEAAESPADDQASAVVLAPDGSSGGGGGLSTVLAKVTAAQLQDALYRLRCHQDLALAEHVLTLSTEIDRLLLRVLAEDFQVHQHLLALKKFMLLGQGDFINCLIDSIGPELKKRASVLFKHNLLSILESSLRASNAQFEEESVLANVSIRLLEANVGDTGWEIFSLDYNIAIPVNSIVHPRAMAQYRIAFHMLWRLKRVEWSLAHTWKDLTNLSQILDKELNHLKYGNQALQPSALTVQHVHDLRRIFHRCNLNRAGMMHIINNLSEFLMFEVLETAWERLRAELDKARSLDDMIEAHDRYLEEILDKALLSPAHETLQLQIQQVLQLILRFCHLEETLVADTLAALARNRLAGGAAAMMDSPVNASLGPARGKAGGLVLAVQPETVPAHLVSRIDETVKEYSTQFDTLMTMLKEEGEKSGEILRYLTFRLDFNGYHQRQKAKGNGLGITSTPRSLESTRPVSGTGKGARFNSPPDLKPTKLSLNEE